MEELVGKHALAAASAVTFSTAIAYPLDTFKTLFQVGADTGRKVDAAQVFRRIQFSSGLSGFYSGLGWTLLGRIPAVGSRFGVYELLTAFYKDGGEVDHLYVSEALLAGLASGALEAAISTPFDVFKLHMQVTSAYHNPYFKHHHMEQSKSSALLGLLHGYVPDKMAWDRTANILSKLPSKHPNLIDALKGYPWMLTGSGRPPAAYDVKGPSQIVSLEGWSSLWRGFRSGLFRDSIFSGIFFSCWQGIHTALLEWKSLDMDDPPRSLAEVGPISPITTSIAAGVSGSIAAAASHSFDTATSRSQCLVVGIGLKWLLARLLAVEDSLTDTKWMLDQLLSLTFLNSYMSMERKFLKWRPPGTWFERLSGIHPTDRRVLLHEIGFHMTRSGLACFALVGSYFLVVDHLFS